jgi:hypothetical protein
LTSNYYRGFFATRRKLIAKEDPKRIKPVLYAYRVLMTGIHLLRTGEVEANLPRLSEHFGLAFLDELIARKIHGENASVGDLDWPLHEARLAELEAQLDRAFQESKLPEDPDRKAIHEFLVGLPLDTGAHEDYDRTVDNPCFPTHRGRESHLYFARFEMIRSILTRSASEGPTYGPRWRFGLVSHSAARSISLQIQSRTLNLQGCCPNGCSRFSIKLGTTQARKILK